MTKECIVCDSSENKVVFQEFGIDILRCINCGHVFSSYDAIQDYDGFFGSQPVQSGNQFWWDEAHEQMYDDFCKRFVAGKRGTLLDVGCGLGYFVKRMSDFPFWQAFGCEISKPAVEYAKAKLGLSNIICNKVQESAFVKKTFDIITLWDVIEHIPNPDPLLSHLSCLLKDNGMLFLHTPNVALQLPKARLFKSMGMTMAYLEAKDHPNNYSMKTMRRILSRNGFSEVKFVHLKPVQSVSGSKSKLLMSLKNWWFYSSVVVFYVSFGRINLDNLFVIAKKTSEPSCVEVEFGGGARSEQGIHNSSPACQ
jgi:SAM-dependent methyltransferase